MNKNASATYKKLKDGTWGVWSDLTGLRPGQSVTVTRYDGETRLERLSKLIWNDSEKGLQSLEHQRPGSRNGTGETFMTANLKDAQGRELNLTETAATAARMLKAQFPFIQFTSGRRTLEDQARAMASNVIRNRKWIAQTYRATDISRSLQEWVTAHPEAKTSAQIQEGLESVMSTFTPDQLVALSRHLDGRAFDVQPITDGRAAGVKLFIIKGLPGLDKFLDHEGGLVRWHLQFTD